MIYELTEKLAQRLESLEIFNVVKFYEGELGNNINEINQRIMGSFPFALCAYDSTSREQGKLRRYTIDFIVILGARSFSGDGMSGIYSLLDAAVDGLDMYRPGIIGATQFIFDSSRHLVHGDAFVLYEQRYSVLITKD